MTSKTKLKMNIKQCIEKFVEETLNDEKNELKIIDLGKIEEKFYQRILDETEEDLNGFLISIDSYSIRHSLNRHGLDKEQNNTQLPIDETDFSELIEVVFEADIILKDEKKGKQSIIFHKEKQTTLIAIFEIRRITSKKKKKVSRIMLQTLYKKKPSTK